MTFVVWGLLGVAVVLLEVAAAMTDGRTNGIRSLASRLLAGRLGTGVLAVGWMWLGWHAFAR